MHATLLRLIKDCSPKTQLLSHRDDVYVGVHGNEEKKKNVSNFTIKV